MSSDQAIRVFAAKEDTSHSVTVRWRSGQVSRLKQLESGYRYLISHPPGPPSVPPVVRPVSKAGIFRQTRFSASFIRGVRSPPFFIGEIYDELNLNKKKPKFIDSQLAKTDRIGKIGLLFVVNGIKKKIEADHKEGGQRGAGPHRARHGAVSCPILVSARRSGAKHMWRTLFFAFSEPSRRGARSTTVSFLPRPRRRASSSRAMPRFALAPPR